VLKVCFIIKNSLGKLKDRFKPGTNTAAFNSS